MSSARVLAGTVDARQYLVCDLNAAVMVTAAVIPAVTA
jgi:hypothetical protein